MHARKRKRLARVEEGLLDRRTMNEAKPSRASEGCQKCNLSDKHPPICNNPREGVRESSAQNDGSGPISGSDSDAGGSGEFAGELPQRRLGGLPALALVAGSMLGIGIFITPAQVAEHMPGPWAFLGMWLLGGVAALLGALSLAELGAMMPRSGGDYAYLRKAWGPGVAYAAGWLQLLVIFPGSLASVAVATSTYQLPVLWTRFLGREMPESFDLLGLQMETPYLTAALIIIGLTALNHVGVKISGLVQVIVTSVPLLVLLVTSVSVLFGPDAEGLAVVADTTETHEFTLSGFGRAYLGVYFAYSGWNAAIFVGGEIKEPGKNLPRALVGGTLLVTAVYLVLCMGFLAVFGFCLLPDVGEAGTAAAVRLFGDAGVGAITLLILLAMLGSLNGTVMIGSRIAFAMARKGDCFAPAGQLHARYGTPVIALWLQAGIAVVLLLTVPKLEALIEYTSGAMLITGTLTVLSVIVLRRRMPELARPYKVLAFPWPPIGYAISSVFVLGLVLMDGDLSVLIAVLWFAAALAWYRFRHSKTKLAQPSP
jgi:APA family basic amino acid/polyamine antiporter